jgi:minor extracellular serine protease Vpr
VDVLKNEYVWAFTSNFIRMTRFLCAVAAFIFAISLLPGQAHLTVGTRLFLADYQKLDPAGDIPGSFREKHDLVPVDGAWCVGVSGIVTPAFSEQEANRMGVHIGSRVGDMRTFRVPLDQVDAFLRLPGLRYADITEVASPYVNQSLISQRVDSVHMGLGGLAGSYFGKDVVIAVIDWGFDYTHPNFYDTTMTQYRVVRAWDQNKLSGPAPAGYHFGTEYVGQDALLQAQSDTLYTFDYTSHGSHVAGIAGGGGAGTPFMGAAPEADLIFISLRRDAPSLIDAFTYIRDYAASVQKPFVVNMSFGLHLWAHDGMRPESLAMDLIQGPGAIFVGSAGNNGSAPFHIDHDFLTAPDTFFTVVNFGNFGASQFGQTLSIWGSPGSSFTAGLRLVDNTNTIALETPLFFSGDSPQLDTVLFVDQDSFRVIVTGVAFDPLNDRPHIQMEIRNRAGRRLVLVLHAEDSHIHVWNTARLYRRYTNWGVAFTDNYPGAKAGDIQYGIGEPGGCGFSTITVASHVRDQFLPNGTQTSGAISAFTSRGPTVDLRVKPEIAGVGQNVASSVNSFDITENSGFVTSVDFEGRTYGWKRYSGTSMSGPLIAGIVALMLEANPTLSNDEAKEILKMTARLDQFTGPIDPAVGNLTWGWGKANALAAVKAAEDLLSADTPVRLTEHHLLLYPNPAKGTVWLRTGADGSPAPMQVRCFSLDGKQTGEWQIPAFHGDWPLHIEGLHGGMYLLQFRRGEELFFQKMLVAD